MLAVTKVKMSDSQKMNKNTYDHFLHKTCNQEVSCCSRAKQRQRNVQKSVLHVKVAFLLIRPIVVVPFSFPLPLSITRLYILFSKLYWNII